MQFAHNISALLESKMLVSVQDIQVSCKLTRKLFSCTFKASKSNKSFNSVQPAYSVHVRETLS